MVELKTFVSKEMHYNPEQVQIFHTYTGNILHSYVLHRELPRKMATESSWRDPASGKKREQERHSHERT